MITLGEATRYGWTRCASQGVSVSVDGDRATVSEVSGGLSLYGALVQVTTNVSETTQGERVQVNDSGVGAGHPGVGHLLGGWCRSSTRGLAQVIQGLGSRDPRGWRR